jgi:hypothetical protein
MFGIGLAIGVGKQHFINSVVYDTDYQALLNRAIALGYTLPSEAQQAKQNQLVLDLKSAGVWSRLDVFYMFATDGNSNFATLNWKAPSSNQATLLNSPSFTSNGGFSGDGVSAYIDTNFNPFAGTINYKLNDASRYYWVDNRVTTGTNAFFEGLASNSANATRNQNSSGQYINQSTTPTTPSYNFAFDGFHGINRTSSTNLTFVNGTSTTNGTAVSVGIVNATQVIFRASSNYNNCRMRFYAMGANMVSQNTDFYNAINTYLTSL